MRPESEPDNEVVDAQRRSAGNEAAKTKPTRRLIGSSSSGLPERLVAGRDKKASAEVRTRGADRARDVMAGYEAEHGHGRFECAEDERNSEPDRPVNARQTDRDRGREIGEAERSSSEDQAEHPAKLQAGVVVRRRPAPLTGVRRPTSQSAPYCPVSRRSVPMTLMRNGPTESRERFPTSRDHKHADCPMWPPQLRTHKSDWVRDNDGCGCAGQVGCRAQNNGYGCDDHHARTGMENEVVLLTHPCR